MDELTTSRFPDVANLPCRDVVIGNPLGEDMKIQVPVYSQETLEECRKSGLIVEFVSDNDLLNDVLRRVKEKVKGK